jgi:hypothetical protein
MWSDEREPALEALDAAARAQPDNLESLYALYQQAASMRGPEAEAAVAWAVERLAELRPENLFVLLKQGKLALESSNRQEATGAYLRVRELVWQAPQPPNRPSASELLELVLEGLEEADLEKTRRPAVFLENVLKAEVMYQRSLDELRTDIHGIPITRLLDEPEPEPFGESVRQRFTGDRTIELRYASSPITDVPGHGRALVAALFDGDTRPDIARLVASASGVELEIRLAANNWLPSRLPASDANRLMTVDLDNDGALDLLAFDHEVTFWRGDGQGGFVDHTQVIGLPARATSVVAFDFDIEGDLDIASSTANEGIDLHRNSLDGPLRPIGERSLPDLEIGNVHQMFPSDLDRDGDLDLLVAHDRGLTFLRNLRQGHFEEATEAVALLETRPMRDALTADLDGDGWPEVLAAGAAGAVAWHNDQGVFAPWVLEGDAALSAPIVAIAVLDVDNDSRLDLALLGESGLVVLRQREAGRFDRIDVEGSTDGTTVVRAADLDQDGDLDLLASGSEGLRWLENLGGNRNHWLDVQLRGLDKGDGKNNWFGIGSVLEVRSGAVYQFRETVERTTHLGLGQDRRADVLRVTWTNGVPQNRLSPTVFQPIVERQILKGSCPFLYTWNGDRIEFVTDLLWGAPLGMPIGDGLWAGADPRELVVIEGAQPRDGIYDFRITEELWEAAYFDSVKLWIVDYPADTELASTLRIVPGEVIDDRLVASSQLRPVQQAWDGRGRDITSRVQERDEIYADGYPVGRYQGVTPEPWSFTFDLGEAPVTPVRLFLDGWIFPGDASLNLAVAQRREPPILTRLEVQTEAGWQVLIAKMGHPAGKTKTLVLDLPPLPSGSQRLRIVSSKWLSWDRIAWSTQPHDADIVVRARLTAETAVLGYRGFSRMVRRAPNAPHRFEYQKVTRRSPWLPMSGRYTRYGEVGELLAEPDDRSVILGPGDEMRLSFDARRIGPPAAGTKRALVLESHGWDKDADRNTFAGDRVEPLPFRAMSGYPFAAGETFPDTPELREYQRQWLTRVVERTAPIDRAAAPSHARVDPVP